MEEDKVRELEGEAGYSEMEPAEESTESQEADLQESEVNIEMLNLANRVHSGANWFYWIAGLSLINSVILLSGSE